jgi:hypothetical protein
VAKAQYPVSEFRCGHFAWRDIDVQLWMCCQSHCQLAISDECFTYESGGEGVEPLSNQKQFGEAHTIAVLPVFRQLRYPVCRQWHLQERCDDSEGRTIWIADAHRGDSHLRRIGLTGWRDFFKLGVD